MNYWGIIHVRVELLAREYARKHMMLAESGGTAAIWNIGSFYLKCKNIFRFLLNYSVSQGIIYIEELVEREFRGKKKAH